MMALEGEMPCTLVRRVRSRHGEETNAGRSGDVAADLHLCGINRALLTSLPTLLYEPKTALIRRETYESRPCCDRSVDRGTKEVEAWRRRDASSASITKMQWNFKNT